MTRTFKSVGCYRKHIMAKPHSLTYRTYAGVSVKRLLRSRIWLQDEYLTYVPSLQYIATEFKTRIAHERLSKLTLNQVEKFYLDGAWNVVLNKYDVDISFKKVQKGKSSDQTSELKCFFLDNSVAILATIKNKIASILDEEDLENSMEGLLNNHVWFNLNRQHKSNFFPMATVFARLFKDTQLKLLNIPETLHLCAHSIWNALMYQAMSYVIKHKIICTEVVKTDGQHDVAIMEMNQLDKRVRANKKETLKRPVKSLLGQRIKTFNTVDREFCVKIPFPSDLTLTPETKILPMKSILKVQRLSKSEVKLRWSPPKKYSNCIITYEIFMLQGLRFQTDLSCWSKITLGKVKALPTTLVIRGLNSGPRYYFTVRGITEDKKVTPISDVQFIVL